MKPTNKKILSSELDMTNFIIEKMIELEHMSHKQAKVTFHNNKKLYEEKYKKDLI